MATKLEIAGTVFAGLAAVGLFTSIGYNYGNDSAQSQIKGLQQELATFKTAKTTKTVFSFLEDLKEYNERLFEFEKHTRQIVELDKKTDELASEKANLSAKVEQQVTQISELRKINEDNDSEINRLNERLALKYTAPEAIEIPENQSHTFLDGLITVGVQDLYSSRIVATINDRTEHLDVGESYKFNIERNSCKLLYVGSAGTPQIEAGKFSLACKSQKKSR